MNLESFNFVSLLSQWAEYGGLATTASNVPIKDIEHHFEDTLFQFFYVFGIEPISLNIHEFTKEKKYLLNGFKEAKLLTFWDKTIAIATTIKVMVIQDIEAKEREKFLKTLLKESLILLEKILIVFMNILPFRKIF